MAKKARPQWFEKYLKRDIRRIFQWSPERAKSRMRAMRPNPNKAIQEFDCELCGNGPLKREEVECDHIEPCQSVDGAADWSEFIRRTLEVKAEGLQWICKPCHTKKSAAENAKRREARKLK